MSQAPPTVPNRCRATRRDGAPCSAPALGSGWCFAHDPDLAAQRAAARKSGGKNSSKIVRLRGLVPPRLVNVYDKLEQALGDVESGQLDPKQANSMANLARAMVAVLTAGELEERVRKLEEVGNGNPRAR